MRRFGDFYLVSLSMDRNYYHNRLSFDLLNSLGLFDLQYAYSELKINGKSQGIYLILQRPQDWALKDQNSPYIVRRGRDHLVDRERVQKDTGQGDEKKISRPVPVDLQTYQSTFRRRSS